MNWTARWLFGAAAALCATLWVASQFGDLLVDLGGANAFIVTAGTVCIDHDTRRWYVEGRDLSPIALNQLELGDRAFVGWNGSPFMRGGKPDAGLHWWPQFIERTGRPAMLPPFLPSSKWQLYIPLWMPFLLLAAPSVIAWRSHIQRQRLGGCSTCGYSLAGLPSGAKCPECGRVDSPQ